MCDPMTIAGVAMTAGSIGLNTMAASRTAKAQGVAMQRQLAGQQQLDAEAQAVNQQSLARYGGFAQGQEGRANELSSFYGSNRAPINAGAGLPTSSNVAIQNEVAKQQSAADAYGAQQDAALGKLRSFGDYLAQQNRGQARDASLIGQIGSFKTGLASTLGYDLQAASMKGQGLQTAGSLLGALGSSLTRGGLTGSLKLA